MTASIRWWDGSQIGLKPDWRLGIANMVSHGVSQVEAGRTDHLRFNCFNSDETDYVAELMRRHPGISYSTTRVAGKSGD